MESKGHFACPECGCREFYISRNYTEYGSCEVLCRFSNQKKDAGVEYDDKEYLDHDGCDTEYGSYGEEMRCRECQLTFTDPAFHEESMEERDARERADEAKRLERDRRIEEEMKAEAVKKPYAAVVSKLEWADDIHIEEMAHATVVVADVSHYTRHDESRQEERVTLECSSCGDEFEELTERTYPLYFAAPFLPSGREKWLDRRGLPVMLRACLCKNCQGINVIQRPEPQAAA